MRTYRASGLGGCMKAQIAEKLGFTPMDTGKQMANMAREGELHEKEVLNRLTGDWMIHGMQQEVVLSLLSEVEVVGHVDALAGEEYVVEVKSMSPDVFKEWKRKLWDAGGMIPKYKWQLSIYMLATGRKAMFCVKNRSSGELDIFRVAEPFYTKDQILGRILEIEKWVRRGELPDECDVNNFPCPFYYLEQTITEDYTEDAELELAAEVYDRARLEVKSKEAELKEARKRLDEVLGDREKVTTDKVKVTYYEQKRDKLDVDKMKDDGIDVDKYYRPQISKALRVSIKKEKDNGEDNESDGVSGPTESQGEGK